MATVKVVQFESDFVILSNQSGRDRNISLDSRGFLWEMATHKDGWTFNKKSMYVIYGRRTIDRIFKELEDNNYMIVVPFRVGRQNDPSYILRPVPFTEDEKVAYKQKAIVEKQIELDEIFKKGEGKKYIWDVHNEQFILDCPKRTTSKDNVLKDNISKNKKDDEEQHPLKTIESLKSEILSTIDVLDEDTYMMVAMRCLNVFHEGGISGKFKNYFMSAIQTEVARLKNQDKNPGKQRKQSKRKEMLPKWLGEDQQQQQAAQDTPDVEEQRRKLEELLKQYKKE